MAADIRGGLGIVPLTAPATIEFLGAESYLAGEDVPLESWLPFLFLKTESDCSLTAYTDDAANMSIGPDMTNYQDVLHQQAGLTTTGDVWPNGCLSSRLGVSSGNGIVERSPADITARPRLLTACSERDSITVGSQTAARLACVHDSADDARKPATLTSVDVNGDGEPDLIVVSDDTDTAAAIIPCSSATATALINRGRTTRLRSTRDT